MPFRGGKEGGEKETEDKNEGPRDLGRLSRWLSSKESACNSGDIGSIPGWGRSPGGSNGNPLQYSCLGNPMDRRASLATIHGVARVQTQLSDYRQQKETLEGKVQRPHSPGPCHQHTSVKPSICLHIQSRLPASTLPT